MGVAAEGGSGCLSGRLKGAVDRELGGNIYVSPLPKCLFFGIFAKHIFL